jgi:carbonic anhydrase/acetyltransferase-like protein (isoleucine patch superfamily)
VSACGPRSSSTQNRVSIAHQAVVVNSSIGNFSFIGFHALIENSVLEDGVFVLHGATVSNVRIPKDRIVPIGAVIKTQRDADALPLKTDAHAKFQKDVLHVNLEFAEQYAVLYEQSGFDAVSGVSVAPKTSFNAKQVKPSLGKNVQLAEFVRIVGDVRIGDNSVIGRRAAIRADEGTPIIIGENADIDNHVTFHALEYSSLKIGRNLKAAHNVVFHGPLEVGDGLNIGRDATLFRSKVGNNVTIGARAIVVDVTLRDGVKVPDNAIITSQDKADALYWPRYR